ncbi:MAG: haloacid dehalogenase-like hydrolase [Thermoleophilaceae bacterium]|nr:haloacid dehalogenase-like hydrolase [Thermoleophilaceae bacterium]
MLLVLWDIDGTLVDSAGHGKHAFEEAFEAVMGRPPGPVEFAGRTDHQIALAMLDHEREALPRLLDRLATALEARKEAMRRDGHAYPGVPETLAALHGREGIVQSLLTGNIQTNAALKISAFGLEPWLDFDVGAYGSDPHEERSELVAVARERVRAKYGEPTDAVLVGDTPHDVRAAHEAGARAVAVATGFSDVNALRAARPDALLADLRDTPAAVEAIARVARSAASD